MINFEKKNYAILMVSLGVGIISLFLIGKPGFMGVAGICMFLTALVLTCINYLDISGKK